ncbi:MAG: FAD-dependent oxidoreductase [Leptolyngbya foveolarum]|uniref:FAD-dependent oxidoreductase n=1 Tax=Leptolyngbya foveolarum TaxID=47253 RepID=A0A2W4WFM3_9CYAN|nr:MAG: FAD-dependent oxidoreductase [Leptolyngbya foveolarum]
MAKQLKIVIVGCGIVGATIAYELSQNISSDIQVLDQQPPAQGSTGAALGVLMGAISVRVKGRTWKLREASIRRHKTLLAELSEQGYSIPHTSGIVSLCFDEDKLPRWTALKEKREKQGWPLEIWHPAELKKRCPQITLDSPEAETPTETRRVKAAIYSSSDGQVDPVALTNALVTAAKVRDVRFHWNAEVTQLEIERQRCVAVQTTQARLEADWVILTAGLGSAALTQFASEPLALIPVLGQAAEIQLPKTLGLKDFQPVINGDDIQFVPLGEGRYWLGATVEFPSEDEALEAQADGIESLLKGAERFCSAIAQAKIIKTWSGLRPRPVGQPAPVIKPLGDTENVTLATGHYRNGVLLAPATALAVCELLQKSDRFTFSP